MAHGNRRYLLLGTGWAAGASIATTGLSFVAGVLLARLLGVAGYGAYQFTLSIIALLGTLAGFGLPRIIERGVAASVATGSWGKVKGLIRFGYVAAIGISGALTLLVLALLHVMRGDAAHLLAIAVFLLPIQALSGAIGAVQLGFKQVVQNSLPQVLRLALFVAVLALLYWMYAETPSLAPEQALYVYLATVALALALAVILVERTRRRLGAQLAEAKPVYEAGSWLRSGMPLMLIAGMLTINNQADILMLGVLAGDEATGVYHAATRIANFLAFALAAMLVPMRPLMAEFHGAGQRERLQGMVTKSVRWVFALTLPLAGLLIFSAGPLLGWLYGEAFAIGAVALALLSLAQLANVACGPVQALLVMSGHEKMAAVGVAISTAVNVALNAALIPLLGIEGAALATALSLITWNLLLVWVCERQLNIRPTIFGRRLVISNHVGTTPDATATSRA